MEQLVEKKAVSSPYWATILGTSSRMNCCAPVTPESPVGKAYDNYQLIMMDYLTYGE